MLKRVTQGDLTQPEEKATFTEAQKEMMQPQAKKCQLVGQGADLPYRLGWSQSPCAYFDSSPVKLIFGFQNYEGINFCYMEQVCGHLLWHHRKCIYYLNTHDYIAIKLYLHKPGAVPNAAYFKPLN